MNKYVALLRGINVGGNNKVSMKELQKALESRGYRNVLTYINSGNIIFETDKPKTTLEADIESIIQERFALTIKVLVCGQAFIKQVCEKIPEDWHNNAAEKTDVMFLWETYANPTAIDLVTINRSVDSVVYIDGVLVWHLKKSDYAASGINKLVGTKIYKSMTIRNINTVRNLFTLMKS